MANKGLSKLKKIVARAKAKRRTDKKTKWTTLVSRASKELYGSKSSSTTRRKRKSSTTRSKSRRARKR